MGGERNLAALLWYLRCPSNRSASVAKVVTEWQLTKHFGNILSVKTYEC